MDFRYSSKLNAVDVMPMEQPDQRLQSRATVSPPVWKKGKRVLTKSSVVRSQQIGALQHHRHGKHSNRAMVALTGILSVTITSGEPISTNMACD